MTGTRHLNIERLYTQLRCTLRYGARASRLLRYTPDMIELLYPATAYPHLSACDRALKVEAVIREAANAIGGNPGHAIAVALSLVPGTFGCTLEHRRRIAGRQLDLAADTFRRVHEEILLFDLAVEIYRLHTTSPAISAPETDTQTPVA
jgi:hypothetical protein